MAIAELRRTETGVTVPQDDRSPLTFFEGIEFKLRTKGATAGDTTVRQRIGELTGDLHGRGGCFSAHAKEYLRCFQPVTGVRFTNTTDVPTLFDQLNPTLEQFDRDKQREVLEYLVHDVTKSIVEKHQPRPAKSGRTDITASSREVAAGFLGKLEDVIMERLEPAPTAGKTQFDHFVTVPVRISEAAGLIYLGLKLGACTPIPPTISPDSMPAAITQTVPSIPAMTETPVPTATATIEPTLTETPIPALVPILGPLPSDTDPQLPFPGYKQENYTDGWNSLKDSWNPLWTKWKLLAADQLGPGGSLVVMPVEGEAGIDCEDAVDGSYKGMTLCPPLDVVHGGLVPFPGMDAAATTDYYPLVIQRSSQFARLTSVGTGTGLVLQEVDAAGNPTRYIKPKNDADGNGGVWVAGEYKAPLPAVDHILSPDELAAKHLYGSGFELKTQFHGVPVDLTVVTSKAVLEQYHQTRGCMPNQEMVKYGASAEDRMAEMVFLGHYVGYLRDRG
jgi:hypothetical protein